MARIRTIKPELPQSESIGRLSRDARLLFIQLWTVVDDSGRFRASSRLLASLLYPYDDDAIGLIGGWLAELEREYCIRRYVVSGDSYLEVCNWLKHQKIDKPSKSRIPPHPCDSTNPREDSRTLAPDLVPSTCTSTKTMEVEFFAGDPEMMVKIAQAHPKLSHLRNEMEIPRAVIDEIIRAIGSDGAQKVLEGTEAYAQSLDDPKFATKPWDFFHEFQYRPHVNGNGKPKRGECPDHPGSGVTDHGFCNGCEYGFRKVEA